MLITAGAVCTLLGMVFLFDAELAWWLYEADARMFGRQIKRTANWESQATMYGIGMIALGIVGIMIGIMLV